MVETTEQRGNDLKDVKQRLSSAKAKRFELIVKLGELAYDKLRQQSNDFSALEQVSNDILRKDIEIYQSQNQLTTLTANKQLCTKCQQPLVEDAKFCGNCGTLNPLFKEANTSYVDCHRCYQQIEDQHAFCPCCGVKQEAR